MIEPPSPDDPRVKHGPDYSHFWRVDENGYRCHYYTWDGETKSLSEWAAEYGIRMKSLIMRLERKMTFADALLKPVSKPRSTRRIYAIKENLLRKDGVSKAERRTKETKSRQKAAQEKLDPEIIQRLPQVAPILQPHRITPLSQEEETKVLEAFFKERKYQAWLRLKAEGRYVAFCKRKAYWRRKCLAAGYARHVAFFLALLEFPKPRNGNRGRPGNHVNDSDVFPATGSDDTQGGVPPETGT